MRAKNFFGFFGGGEICLEIFSVFWRFLTFFVIFLWFFCFFLRQISHHQKMRQKKITLKIALKSFKNDFKAKKKKFFPAKFFFFWLRKFFFFFKKSRNHVYLWYLADLVLIWADPKSFTPPQKSCLWAILRTFPWPYKLILWGFCNTHGYYKTPRDELRRSTLRLSKLIKTIIL